jgi:hypothetical protein
MQVDLASALLDLDRQFPADASERRVLDVAQAASSLHERRPDLVAVMQEVGQAYLAAFGEEQRDLLKRVQDALALSFVRMATRHGSWGTDLHEYHNEQHALELLNGRLARARLQLGWKVLEAQDWLLLALFSTCHDLRQREAADYWHDIGANERASIAEAFRVLDLVGFSRQQDREFYLSLGLMIAGSTFDARPGARNSFNTAEVASSGGSLAPKLVAELSHGRPPEELDSVSARRARLMLFAADLDTANVGEPFASLAGSGVRLVQEREKRAGRALNAAESAQPVFDFLTSGQERYFFELHRFVSPLGLEVFGKRNNEPKVQWQSRRMRELFPGGPTPGQTGQHVIEAFLRLADEIG